jgi:hypothetical protein
MTQAHTAIQFSVFLINKPGVLAQVTGALAEAKVNLVALTLVDAQEHGVVRFVAGNPAEARRVLERLNLPMTETEVIVLDLSNHPGALADVATKLGQNHININYAYATSGAPGGRTSGIFKVGDLKKALHLLEKPDTKARETTARRAPRSR